MSSIPKRDIAGARTKSTLRTALFVFSTLELFSCTAKETVSPIQNCQFGATQVAAFADRNLPDLVERMGMRSGRVIVLTPNGPSFLRTEVVKGGNEPLIVLVAASIESEGRCYLTLENVQVPDAEMPFEIWQVEPTKGGILDRVGPNLLR